MSALFSRFLSLAHVQYKQNGFTQNNFFSVFELFLSKIIHNKEYRG